MSDVRDRQLDIAGLRRQQPRGCRCVIRPSVVGRVRVCSATVRSCGRAPIISVASASINACNTISTERRMTSISPPARTASSSSDRSNSSWASGVVSFVNPARNTTTITPMAHLTVDPHLTYTTRRDGIGGSAPNPVTSLRKRMSGQRSQRLTGDRAISPIKGLVDSMSCAMIARSCTSRVSGACPVAAPDGPVGNCGASCGVGAVGRSGESTDDDMACGVGGVAVGVRRRRGAPHDGEHRRRFATARRVGGDNDLIEHIDDGRTHADNADHERRADGSADHTGSRTGIGRRVGAGARRCADGRVDTAGVRSRLRRRVGVLGAC